MFFLFVLAIAGSRVLYFFFCGREICDTYGYFAKAVIQANKEEIVFSSGISCLYTGTLSDIFLFTGNRIEAAGICQMIFQILWLILFFAGVKMLAGTAAGITAGGILAFSPQVAGLVFEISPDNFFMLHFGMVLVILGCFYRRAQGEGWHWNIWEELYLMMTGVCLGVICLWNYLGFSLILPAVFVLVKSYRMHKNTGQEQEGKLAGPVVFLLFGILAGFFAAMVNEAQVTGNSLSAQFLLWPVSFRVFPERCQEIDTGLAIWILCSMGAGILCRLAVAYLPRKLKAAGEEGMEMAKEVMDVNKNQDNYVVTSDGRKIKLLDNPLPVPKRHVKKEMRFDIEDVNGDMEELEDNFTLEPENKTGEGPEDEFDFQINDGDDFDI